MPDNEPHLNNPDLRTPVPWGTRPEGPDWDRIAAARIAELAASDRGAALAYVHEIEHKHGSPHLHEVSPWRVLEHLADRLAANPEPGTAPPGGAPSA